MMALWLRLLIQKKVFENTEGNILKIKYVSEVSISKIKPFFLAKTNWCIRYSKQTVICNWKETVY